MPTKKPASTPQTAGPLAGNALAAASPDIVIRMCRDGRILDFHDPDIGVERDLALEIAIRFLFGEGLGLVRTHKSAISGHIGSQYCRKPSLDAFVGHDPSQSRVIVESLCFRRGRVYRGRIAAMGNTKTNGNVHGMSPLVGTRLWAKNCAPLTSR